jgi:exopolyphosphatase/guanosine-5'-triphosphate,3'-diphosphate pyrophosphatase
MRVGVIDCGTNTTRLLIAESDSVGGVCEVLRDLRYSRLGEGVDATGSFNAEAIARTLGHVREFAEILSRHRVDQVRFVATSATRDARNRETFLSKVRMILGIDPEVITGEEEAHLSFLGALSGASIVPQNPDSTVEQLRGLDPATSRRVTERGALTPSRGSAPTLPRDPAPTQPRHSAPTQGRHSAPTQGRLSARSRRIQNSQSHGGSLPTIQARTSLNVGSVRLRERFLHDDPPTATQVDEARGFVQHLLDGAVDLLEPVDIFIGVAGTLTSLSAMNQQLATYDRSRVHNSVLAVDEITDLSQRLLELSVEETLETYPSLHPERAQVICAGGLIAAEIAQHIGLDMIVRETDILDGVAMTLLEDVS